MHAPVYAPFWTYFRKIYLTQIGTKRLANICGIFFGKYVDLIVIYGLRVKLTQSEPKYP